MTYHADEPVENERCGGVVCAVVERRDALVLPAVVPLLKVSPATRVQSTDRLSTYKQRYFSMVAENHTFHYYFNKQLLFYNIFNPTL